MKKNFLKPSPASPLHAAQRTKNLPHLDLGHVTIRKDDKVKAVYLGETIVGIAVSFFEEIGAIVSEKLKAIIKTDSGLIQVSARQLSLV